MDPHEAYAVMIGAKPYEMRLTLRREHGEALLEWIDGGGFLPGQINHMTRSEARAHVQSTIAYLDEQRHHREAR